MKTIMGQYFQNIKPIKIFTGLTGLIIVTQLLAIGVQAYLGTFNRYIADDYCESVQVRDEPVLSAVVNRYMDGSFRSSDRYSNLMFVGISQMLGKYNNQILPASMLIIWLVGLIWSLNQIRKLMELRLSRIFDLLIAISITFFSMWQAPNPFQTFIWRSGMATHFAPLAFLSLFVGFVLCQINTGKKPGVWVYLFVVFCAFIIGGFSEPPATFMIASLVLLILSIRWWDNDAKKSRTLTFLAYSLIGFLLAFFTMFLSPGNVSHGTASLSNLPVAFLRTIQFTYNFMDDTVRTLPFPTLISVLTSFVISFVFSLISGNNLSPYQRNRIWMFFLIVPIIQFLLIASSFAPSAYAQSYPAERAQILGRLVMTTALLLEGVLLGILFSQAKVLFSLRRPAILLGSLLFFVLAFYPLRAGWSLFTDVSDYREWAFAWDLREAEIKKAIATGETDLVVMWLPTREGVKEIDATTTLWVNRCAADYYGVDSIRSDR